MLKIKKNESNHIILVIENEESEIVEIEITDTSLILCQANAKEVSEFKENVMEFHGNNREYFIRRVNGTIHVYDNQQVDIYIH